MAQHIHVESEESRNERSRSYNFFKAKCEICGQEFNPVDQMKNVYTQTINTIVYNALWEGVIDNGGYTFTTTTAMPPNITTNTT